MLDIQAAYVGLFVVMFKGVGRGVVGPAVGFFVVAADGRFVLVIFAEGRRVFVEGRKVDGALVDGCKVVGREVGPSVFAVIPRLGDKVTVAIPSCIISSSSKGTFVIESSSVTVSTKTRSASNASNGTASHKKRLRWPFVAISPQIQSPMKRDSL